jgi:hypothetical protein
VIWTSTYSRSQESGTLMELLEEAQVVLEEQRRSVMPCLSILIRSGPIPNAKPLVVLRIQPAVLEHDRVDHPGAKDRHPAGSTTGRDSPIHHRPGIPTSKATDGSVNG